MSREELIDRAVIWAAFSAVSKPSQASILEYLSAPENAQWVLNYICHHWWYWGENPGSRARGIAVGRKFYPA